MSKRTLNVGIIGCGSRGLNNIGFNLVDSFEETSFLVKAVANRSLPSTNYAADQLEKWYGEAGIDQQVSRCSSYKEIINDDSIDFVIITSHTDAHLEHAVPAIESGKKVFLEKPIAVDLEEGRSIAEAEKRTGNTAMMGFTRRYEDSWVKMKELLDDGKVGSLQMILLRSIIPYSRYLQGWHRKREWSGGPLNDKCSHHFDVLRWMSDSDFNSVSAYGGRSGVFKPDPDAPKYCSDCDRECAYRRSNVLEESKETTGNKYIAPKSEQDARSIQDACVYSPDSDVEDFGSINFQMDNGVVGNLFFTIFGPLYHDGETLEMVGDSGRLVLTRSNGRILAISNHGKDIEEISAGGPHFETSHYGSDWNLVRLMREYCDGADPVCTVQDGLAALEMVNSARESFDAKGDRKIISNI
jgi:predicted dehydrogenase